MTQIILILGVDFRSYVEYRKETEINPNDENLSGVCFENLFPRAKGHATFIDECHSSRRLTYCR